MNKKQASERVEAIRRAIRSSEIIAALTDHVLLGREMTSTQVTAALGLLKKDLPDLAAQQMDVHSEGITVILQSQNGD